MMRIVHVASPLSTTARMEYGVASSSIRVAGVHNIHIYIYGLIAWPFLAAVSI
jgi:hypothetical protein